MEQREGNKDGSRGDHRLKQRNSGEMNSSISMTGAREFVRSVVMEGFCPYDACGGG